MSLLCLLYTKTCISSSTCVIIITLPHCPLSHMHGSMGTLPEILLSHAPSAPLPWLAPAFLKGRAVSSTATPVSCSTKHWVSGHGAPSSLCHHAWLTPVSTRGVETGTYWCSPLLARHRRCLGDTRAPKFATSPFLPPNFSKFPQLPHTDSWYNFPLSEPTTSDKYVLVGIYCYYCVCASWYCYCQSGCGARSSSMAP